MISFHFVFLLRSCAKLPLDDTLIVTRLLISYTRPRQTSPIDNSSRLPHPLDAKIGIDPTYRSRSPCIPHHPDPDPNLLPPGRRALDTVRPYDDQGHHRHGLFARHGQGPNRALCRGSDLAGYRCGLH